MSAQVDYHKALYALMTGNTALMSLVDGVHDRVPEKPFKTKNAYISFGSAVVVDDGADCIVSDIHTRQIDIWSRKVGSIECAHIVDVVKKAVHDKDVTLEDGQIVHTLVDLSRVIEDADGLTWHGIVQVTASIEDIS
ncbi:DUF3168 domain-containing protein [Rhizobium sp. CNPSo 4062]|uniref:DUF3168 domain-containing protein n=1 Tax=Rhizobium sp. CNPSo 4062 TaxID=3021410 RepID=UPI002550756B|nr:DUF3168 domain-containing protein [Rhizobium sp. CNPSo 4062]MDK4704328.1 DUF3168 domain-containing protein [Rhizobium sp. CNPSo 4062]